MELFSETRITDLEEKIDNLINGYLSMKKEHENALARLQSVEAENAQLKERVNSVKTERELIIDKVTKLLEKVEKVEV
jgi:chromosome segregation ATPase